ncbi:ABC transporter substrate-binding protein [Kocuria sp. p3-SID1433]|uniref:siderophore ABC transporter substrate-binding protein n=1 Tax=unclassified Kocuria TaxID=2649579 RepID=UPI0021A2CFCD|nr:MULTISPECIES: ABC transporter substrate-binding protein [unclassified Kocuria]MCT1601197.1 ABC transporter substrate-binding protein [Kocuria sp. p3-SID1428]MCT2179576.1 ABC transporter substrate-binding protein [Kocuria sp. p3-SID1433]
MPAPSRRSGAALAALPLALALGLTACGSDEDADSSTSDGSTVEVEDNFGTQEVPSPADSVVATDNRTFETLCDWDIDLAAAPKPLIPETIECWQGEDTIDIGNHREPDLEALAGAQPDLVVNGQRFADHRSDIEELVPEAALVEFEPREGEDFFDELQRQTTGMGTVFGHEDDAEQLNSALDDASQRVSETYQEGDTVMAVNVSGGEIGYIAPGLGRTFGPLFDEFGFTPALEIEGSSDDHQGDDVSVEAIAEADPDWIIVLDRDAAVEEDSSPAEEIISGSEALQNTTAVKEGQVYYAPADTYTNESIQTYTEIFDGLADAFEGAKS